MIARLNKGFVCTYILIDDLQKHAANGDPLAKHLADDWEYPLELVFLTPEGKLLSRLNSYKDFPGIHRDVVAPPSGKHQALTDEHSHQHIFLKHLDEHFGKN